MQSLGWVWLEAACFGSGSVRTRGASSGLGVAQGFTFLQKGLGVD